MTKNIYYTTIFIILLFSSQLILSQTWVRKVDGYSMWSIAKDYAGNIYAGTTGSNRGIFKSTDGGETWNNVFSTGASNYLGIACDSLNNVYVANTTNGMLISTDGGQSFTLVASSVFGGKTVNMVGCGKNGHIFVGTTNGGIWRSTDFGATFTNTALQSFTIVTLAVDKFNPDIIYAGSSSSGTNGFFVSTDDGLTFSSSTNDINVWEILQTSNGYLYTASTSSPYPFDCSTDGGFTWTTMSNQPAAMRGATLDLLENIYIAGNGGVFKSTDGGASFINFGLTYSSNKILTYENKIMVCVIGSTNGGVWIYTDTSVPVELTSFTAKANSDGSVLLNWATATETNNSGFEIQRLNPQSELSNPKWSKIGFVAGFGTTSQPEIYSFIDKNVSSGTFNYRLKQIDLDGTFKYSKEVEVNINIPQKFSLSQNYPNPFNPTTKIEYHLANSGFVSLKVYDVLGSEVATLVKGNKPAGKYTIEFDASKLASGVYYYRLESGSNVMIKKMILLR